VCVCVSVCVFMCVFVCVSTGDVNYFGIHRKSACILGRMTELGIPNQTGESVASCGHEFGMHKCNAANNLFFSGVFGFTYLNRLS
jgi:hypothetical protein